MSSNGQWLKFEVNCRVFGGWRGSWRGFTDKKALQADKLALRVQLQMTMGAWAWRRLELAASNADLVPLIEC